MHRESAVRSDVLGGDRGDPCGAPSLSNAGPGDPAAHQTIRLPLLPSGPGGVHRVWLHRAQPLSLGARHIAPRGRVATPLPVPAHHDLLVLWHATGRWLMNEGFSRAEPRAQRPQIIHHLCEWPPQRGEAHPPFCISKRRARATMLRGSVVAERVGFEPTVGLPRRMLSKHVDSATLAPLRAIPAGAHLSMVGEKEATRWRAYNA